MTTLFVLIMIQLAGIVLSLFFSCLINWIEHRRSVRLQHMKHALHHSQQNSQWLIDYFQEFPDSLLRFDFPHAYRIAKATRRYKELSDLRAQGVISEQVYQNQLNKILPLIDIKNDVAALLHSSE